MGVGEKSDRDSAVRRTPRLAHPRRAAAGARAFRSITRSLCCSPRIVRTPLCWRTSTSSSAIPGRSASTFQAPPCRTPGERDGRRLRHGDVPMRSLWRSHKKWDGQKNIMKSMASTPQIATRARAISHTTRLSSAIPTKNRKVEITSKSAGPPASVPSRSRWMLDQVIAHITAWQQILASVATPYPVVRRHAPGLQSVNTGRSHPQRR